MDQFFISFFFSPSTGVKNGSEESVTGNGSDGEISFRRRFRQIQPESAVSTAAEVVDYGLTVVVA